MIPFLLVENVSEIDPHLHVCVNKACFNIAILFENSIVYLFQLVQMKNAFYYSFKIIYSGFKKYTLKVPFCWSLEEPEM